MYAGWQDVDDLGDHGVQSQFMETMAECLFVCYFPMISGVSFSILLSYLRFSRNYTLVLWWHDNAISYSSSIRMFADSYPVRLAILELDTLGAWLMDLSLDPADPVASSSKGRWSTETKIGGWINFIAVPSPPGPPICPPLNFIFQPFQISKNCDASSGLVWYNWYPLNRNTGPAKRTIINY